MKKFEELKEEFNVNHFTSNELDCFLPVHLTRNKIESNIRKKDGSFNEQYYKWQFLNCYVEAGYCSKDYIGVEISIPKGNKNSAHMQIDAVIFDDANWFSYYKDFHTSKDDTKWDKLEWLKSHIICTIEFKKENSKDIKGVANSQLKAYMNESLKENVLGILYDEEKLYLFKQVGKSFQRLSEEFNNDRKGKVIPTYELPDAYDNLLSFDEILNDVNSKQNLIKDYSNRNLKDLNIISKTDSKKVNDALYEILHTMDKTGLNSQKGYNILIQLLALKIYDEKYNSSNLEYYINPRETDFSKISDGDLQDFLERILDLRKDAKDVYSKILNYNSFDIKNLNHVRVMIEIVDQFQNYSFSDSKRNNLYQLVFHRFASEFSKADNAQFITPLQVIDFIVDIVNPKNEESVIDPTVGIADFLSVSYVKSNGTLNDENIYGIDIDEDMVKLATLNMLLNGDGQATIETKADGLGSIMSKFDSNGKFIELIPEANEKRKYNYNGNWDNRPDNKKLKKFDVVLTNPPFGKARSWEPKSETEIGVAKCYELWNKYDQTQIDLGIIFLENAVRVLKENGRMAIVLSNSIASISEHTEARKWLMENMRVVAMFDLPSNIFAEAGVSPTIIIAYKPKANELNDLKKNNYEVFSREIKKVGYEVRTIKKIKTFVPQYKINPLTFDKEINPDGTPMLDEEFTTTIKEFKQWCNKQEHILKKIFL